MSAPTIVIAEDHPMFREALVLTLSSLPKNAGCGAVGNVRGLAGGFYWKVYSGKMGYLTTGPELQYVTDTTYTAANGTVGRTKDPMVFLTFRYYPFQSSSHY
jgi:hypothetical protein